MSDIVIHVVMIIVTDLSLILFAWLGFKAGYQFRKDEEKDEG